MFYQESYNCTIYKRNPKIVEDMDYFLGILRREESKLITIPNVSSKLEIPMDIAHSLLKYYTENLILKKQYLLICPECGYIIRSYEEKEQLEAELSELHFCMECENTVSCGMENIGIVYRRIKQSTASQEEIEKTLLSHGLIEKIEDKEESFFSNAGSLNYGAIIEQAFKCDESAYTKLQKMYNNLDKNFKNSKEKGDAYEKLVVDVLNKINGVKATSIVKTETNQIDCVAISQINTPYLSIYTYLSPKFICECKNESKTPGITYVEKLHSIMNMSPNTNLAIIFSRKKWSQECKTFARELLLREKKYMINFSDEDWEVFFKKEMEFLVILSLKIIENEMNIKKNISLIQELSKKKHK